MAQFVLRHKEPYKIQGGFIPPIILWWYHDMEDPYLHIQHCIQGDQETAEVTTHVHFDEDYMKDCEEVSWEDVPKVVQEEFQKVWKRWTINPS